MKREELVDVNVLELVRRAIAEDVGTGDVTTESVIPEDHASSGAIVMKSDGVVAGLDVAAAVFREIDRRILFRPRARDGERVRSGAVLAVVDGPTRGILTAERVALNFLQHLSGIATAAASCAAILKGTRTRLLDTRKTTPGMRALEKYAVSVGGGLNHRAGLYDMVLIKDNHIDAAGGIGPAVAAARARHPELGLEVETKTLEQVRQAVAAGADRIMLDNMSVAQMKESIAVARAASSAPEIEVSGGVTPESLTAIAGLGADFVSVGALTHSVKALDISLALSPRDQTP
ncbi:MAG: carboxylating nicotinate-nucleotide diphosphorylase [Candidatus Eisenbacteria bacterium]|nr:carboxylating nicotinate-nucleotide diphosphorylase [Candidatus Eisenbacteria bacterium]